MISAVAPSEIARAITSRTWTEASSTDPPQRFVGEQHVLGVEEQDPDFFDPPVRHRRVKIIGERVPARQQRPAFEACFEQAQRNGLGDLECGDRRSVRPSRRRVSALAPRVAVRSRRNRASSLFARGLVSTRGMVKASRYSTSS